MAKSKTDRALEEALAALEAELGKLGPAGKGGKQAREALNAAVVSLRKAVGKV